MTARRVKSNGRGYVAKQTEGHLQPMIVRAPGNSLQKPRRKTEVSPTQTYLTAVRSTTERIFPPTAGTQRLFNHSVLSRGGSCGHDVDVAQSIILTLLRNQI